MILSCKRLYDAMLHVVFTWWTLTIPFRTCTMFVSTIHRTIQLMTNQHTIHPTMPTLLLACVVLISIAPNVESQTDLSDEPKEISNFCESNDNMCSPNANCVVDQQKAIGYACTCHDGFVGDGFHCEKPCSPEQLKSLGDLKSLNPEGRPVLDGVDLCFNNDPTKMCKPMESNKAECQCGISHQLWRQPYSRNPCIPVNKCETETHDCSVNRRCTIKSVNATDTDGLWSLVFYLVEKAFNSTGPDLEAKTFDCPCLPGSKCEDSKENVPERNRGTVVPDNTSGRAKLLALIAKGLNMKISEDDVNDEDVNEDFLKCAGCTIVSLFGGHCYDVGWPLECPPAIRG